MSERFFLAGPPQGHHATLTADEARHCSRVLRAQVGETIRVFDGHGHEWVAKITRIERDAVAVEIDEPLPPQPPPALRLTLAVALPKGDRQKWLVEKLTELGVTRLVPLVTERGVAEATDAARTRLERGVIEACKQCGRNRLLEIAAPATLDQAAERHPAACRVIAHPGGEPLHAVTALAAGQDMLAAVGPEGGFTAAEIAVATTAGYAPVSLGPEILRIETAAMALAAWARLSPSA